ncbi:MAG: hypothetical protein ABIC82_02415 [bacterium]
MIFNKLEISLKEFIKKDKLIKVTIFLSILFNLINWGLIYYRFTRFLAGQEESIILHYNIYFGIDKIGDWTNIYYLPLIGLAILFINLLGGYLLYQKDKLISYFFLSVAFLVQILLILATFFIIVVNQY